MTLAHPPRLLLPRATGNAPNSPVAKECYLVKQMTGKAGGTGFLLARDIVSKLFAA